MLASNPDQQQDYPFFDALSHHDSLYNAFHYHLWLTTPTSVKHRKKHFLKFMMNLTLQHHHHENQSDDQRIIESSSSDAVLRDDEDEISSLNSDDAAASRDNFICNQQGCKQIEDSSSPLLQKLVHRQIKVAGTMPTTLLNKLKTQCLTRLRSMACLVDPQRTRFHDDFRDAARTRVQRVKVRQYKKQLKELSAVFIGQDIQAHQGSILTMKFSQDARYLATSGEDGVVRIWRVVEDDRSNDTDIPDMDPSCIYFTVNPLSEISPLVAEKHKLSMLKTLRKTSDSACVIVPPKVFRILEKPVHEFHGHKGEVLDLSWSSHNLLLSSSVDQTVCLWRVGSDQCIKVFPHSNYDNQFQLEASVCLNSKKKWACKRIIGFQFCPQDASKVMVTCADSHVRILHGINVIGKYKGQRNGGNQVCASFTSDGKHIVSACEDSNIYIWKCNNEKEDQEKTVRSFESFSSDASVVLPWCGLKENGWNLQDGSFSPGYFSLGPESINQKGSATWPEEKLPASNSPLCKSQYNFFKSCWRRSAGCHLWGLVIVTAGWDGHIRSFLNYGLPVTL
ncbi:WD repeat-containing protein 44 isoform X2 [Helianthus annuus]|uniref:WD repeat-containing protein 44 isoform X2 n=1 Tax=Helianthus annuus TaxID=4232 RepID=UPI000B8F01C7|nr:WD repeat-containing protein 44 isoform X2 [Helianthus annuus]